MFGILSLQRVMTVAAHVIIMNLSFHDHMKLALKQLHWVPVEQRITYKLLSLLMHLIHDGQAEQYSTVCLQTTFQLGDDVRR